ncbi:winged-helix domain-containing protein [Natrinema altunense]|uniref:Phage repressor protein n=1 Tax=Natrinema altunense TaxID=222984 RepID=A0A482XZS4_9EURY|nr:winged-helix domain-containing protein [Natrinema altunense]RZH67026.1 phage repressor protein [Natrinema altunense]
MSLKDGLILEFLEMHDLELPAKPLYRNLNRHGHEIGYSTVRQRLSELEEHGLIEKIDEAGYYAITERGQAYLAGDLSIDDLTVRED